MPPAAMPQAGADEIVWLNISAADEQWQQLLDAVHRAAQTVDVPLCVGGGVTSVERAPRPAAAGADKVATNTAALDRPELVSELADRFGAQCVVVAIDAQRENGALAGLRVGGAAPHRPRRDRVVARGGRARGG